MYHRYLFAAVLATGAVWACSGEQPETLPTSNSGATSSNRHFGVI